MSRLVPVITGLSYVLMGVAMGVISYFLFDDSWWGIVFDIVGSLVVGCFSWKYISRVVWFKRESEWNE